jgi:hypothetical protein
MFRGNAFLGQVPLSGAGARGLGQAIPGTLDDKLTELVKATKQLNEYKNAPGVPDSLVARVAGRVYQLEKAFVTQFAQSRGYPYTYYGGGQDLEEWQKKYGADLPAWIENLFFYPPTTVKPSEEPPFIKPSVFEMTQEEMASELERLKADLEDSSSTVYKRSDEYEKLANMANEAYKKYDEDLTVESKKALDEAILSAKQKYKDYERALKDFHLIEKAIKDIKSEGGKKPLPPGPYEAMIQPIERAFVQTPSALRPMPLVSAATQPMETMPTAGLTAPRPQAAPVATGGPGQCPPGQFWDGRKCRGAVDVSAAGLISAAGGLGPGGGVPASAIALKGYPVVNMAGGGGVSVPAQHKRWKSRYKLWGPWWSWWQRENEVVNFPTSP